MKINKKIVLGLTLTFLLSATVAYAASSSDFLVKAQKYITNNCADRHIDNQTSLNCYLFYKVGELGTQVNSNTTRITALENAPSPSPTASPSSVSQKELKTFDNNGNELGIYMDDASFFVTSLGKKVRLNSAGQLLYQQLATYFKSQNCVGTAYRSTSDLFNDVFSDANGKNLVVDRSIPKENFTSQSYLEFNPAQQASSCRVSSDSQNDASTLTTVTLPFSLPVSMPLQFKYQ